MSVSRWTLYPAIAMSLGWGLRGYIGGGPLGAMIPGAMVALVLCLLLEREESDAAIIAAFGAVGVGFGGEMTYGQTIGHSLKPETMWFGLTGLGVKGAIWGLLAGAIIGLALVRRFFCTRDIILGLSLMVCGTWIGWKLINEPKLIYFSNRYDKPRPEIWAGLLIGALLLLAWLAYCHSTRIPQRLAAFACIGGGIGFFTGGAIQVMGRSQGPGIFNDWWKVMEFTFGFCFGWALGYCAWRCRDELREASPAPEGSPLLWVLLLATCGATLAGIVPGRFSYTVTGAVLLAIAAGSAVMSRQIAITMTYCAFAIDFIRNKPQLDSRPLWVIVALTTSLVLYWMYRKPGVRTMFLFLTLAAVGVSYCKAFIAAQKYPVSVELIFTALLLATLWMSCRAKATLALVALCAFTVHAGDGPLSSATQEWTVKLDPPAGPAVHIGPVESATAVAVAQTSGVITVIGPKGGKLREMKMDLAAGSSPVSDGTRLYGADVWGAIYCFDETGKRLWKFPRQDRYGSGYNNLIMADIDGDGRKEILVSTQRGYLFALDTSGRLRLELRVTNFRISTPAVGDTFGNGKPVIVFSNDDGEVYCVDGAGNVLWVYRAENMRFGRTLPLLADADGDGRYEVYLGTPFVGLNAGIRALDAHTGKLLWRAKSQLQTYNSIVVADVDGDGRNEILYGDKNTRLYAVDTAGKAKWDRQLGGTGIYFAAAIADLQGNGKPVVLQVVRDRGVEGNSIYAINGSGEMVDAAPLERGSSAGAYVPPILTRFQGSPDIHLLVLTRDGALVCSRPPQQAGAKIVWPGTRNDATLTGFVASAKKADGNAPKAAASVATAARRNALAGRNRIPVTRREGAFASVRVVDPDNSVHLTFLRKDDRPEAEFSTSRTGDYRVTTTWIGDDGNTLATEAVTYTLDAAHTEDTRLLRAFEQQVSSLRTQLGRHAELADHFLAMARGFQEKKRDERGYWMALLKYAGRTAPTQSLRVEQLHNPWSALDPEAALAAATGKASNQIRVSMLGNEYESAAVALINLAPRDVTVRIQTDASAARVIQLRSAPDIRRVASGIVSEDVLPLLAQGQTLRLAAGETVKLWLTFHSASLKPGEFRTRLLIGDLTSVDAPLEVPVTVEVSPVRLPEKRVYTHNNWLSLASINDPAVLDATIADALAHGTNAFVIPGVAFRVNPNGTLGDIVSTKHDALVKKLRGKAYFMVTGTVQIQWPAGVRIAPAIQDRAFAEGIRRYVAHMRALGVGPDDWGFYVRDEPGLNGQDPVYDQWEREVRRIKAADPGARIYANPAGGATVQMMRGVQDLIDVWQPDIHLFRDDERGFGEVFQHGKFWHYEAPGEQRELDPLGFYRMKPWVTFQTGMTGGGYWVYSYSPYWFFDRTMAVEYGAVYATEHGPVTSKRWEASRDGIEDFELLWMLRERARAAGDAGKPALALIDEAVGWVTKGQEHASDIARKLHPFTPDYDRWMDYRARLIAAAVRLWER